MPPKEAKSKGQVEKKANVEEAEISEEDAKLKEKLELLVERAQDKVVGIRVQALASLKDEISSATCSMTSIPKPLKFLHPFYDALKVFYRGGNVSTDKVQFADVLSCLAMTMSQPESRESLKFRLDGSVKDSRSWGHEYIRHLALELGQECSELVEKSESVEHLYPYIREVVEFHMKHNAEADACDLLMEVDNLEWLPSLVSVDIADRVCLYLLKCAYYVADTDELDKMLNIIFDIYMQSENLCDALRVAIRMDNKSLMSSCFRVSPNSRLTKQLGLILGAHKLTLDAFEEDEDLMEIVGNCKLNEHFLNLGRELNVQEVKHPDDVYKSHLADSHGRGKKGATGGVDSAKENLASTFVNAFVHAGFGKDLLMTPEDSDWLYKNKDHGMLSATASLGLINLWDLETGFSAIDKFSFSNEDHVKAGVLLATGMISCGVTSDMDAAFALLCDHLESDSKDLKLAACIGMGFAYAGTAREDVLELLQPIVLDCDVSMELSSFAALSLGLVYIGTCSDDVCGSIIQTFMERPASDLESCFSTFLSLGLALLYLGRGEDADAVVEAVSVVEHPISEYVKLTVQTLAYAGTGNVLQVQRLLSIAGERFEKDEEKKDEEGADSDQADASEDKNESDKTDDSKEKELLALHQIAVMGISVIAMGEELGVEMATRAFDNLLQYGDVGVRRAVPLALSLLYVSNPNMVIMETLSKLTHDHDEQVSQNAVLGLGLIGAGTNNSRIAKMLRHLAVYYQKEPNHLFLVRVAQGLVHLGKGLLSLDPFHSDNMLLSKTALGGILTVLHASTNMKETIFSSRHFILYYLVCAIRPRMLITLDEELNPLPVQVRVGTAVDTVRQAGKPKTITGFQTYTTPVLISRGERAELGTDQYIADTSVLEGFVILRKNPDMQLSEE
eukprot:221681_1